MLPFIKTRIPDENEGGVKRLEKEGVALDKGVVLTEDFLNDSQELFEKYGNLFSSYPDVFLDLITPEEEEFKLFFYQRIFLRAVMRFRLVYVTACRAWSKSFLTILGLFLQCIFIPNRKVFICAPNKSQGAQIAKEKIQEIYRHWPLLRKEVKGCELSDTPGNFGKDYVTIKFKNGSVFDVVGALESTLGGRRHGGLIDEIKIHDEEAINTIVIPLLNVDRRLPDNTVNPKEPNQQVICCTSAWAKTSFAYDRLIDNFETAIINPKDAFVFGCDYRVPVIHGLLNERAIQALKMSPSFNETTFATEYMSIWQGASSESWFNFDRLQKYRILKNPETHEIIRSQSDQFYLLSVDIGRIHDQTVVCVFRVNVRDSRLFTSLVNVIVLGKNAQEKTFAHQAADIKDLIQKYNPREVVIDTNGVGAGLGDFMIQESYGLNGQIYEPYGFFNDDNYKKVQPKNCPNILYSMKANGPLKSKIHGNCYARLNSGLVRFLIKETEAKSALLSTKVGQKMTVEQRVKRLMPHEMTTKLFEEMSNLRLKRTGAGLDIILEPINTRFPDDKYMAFAYGLWRIKELEDELQKRKKRRGGSTQQFMFFSGGKY